MAQKVVLHYRPGRWDMHSMAGSLKEVEVEGGPQRTNRTRFRMARPAVGMGDPGTEEVALLSKGKGP